MSVSSLAWRSDLLVSQHQATEDKAFVIKDPVTGRFFRLREIEHFIARQLDGTISLEELQRRLGEKFDSTVPTETLERFIERLRGLGLLADARSAAATAARPAGPVRGNLFYLRFKIFDPDRLLDWLITKLRFLMTPAFVTSSATLIASAFVVTFCNWPQITREFSGLWRLESLFLMWFIVLLIITAHEFAHGLTCKHFGGQVHEMGFMLIYFQPAFYCNVSDAWLFPEKRKRLWVTFAGAYFELFLWALSTIVWRLTDPATTLNHLALVVTATSAIKWLFNFNPLIKLDGYYLLSDWLEIPNLRARATGHLGNVVRRLWGSPVPEVAQSTPRERRIFWIYGLLAWTYSWWLLSVVAWHLGHALVGHYQGWGFIAFTIFLGGIFQRPLTSLLRAPLARAKSGLTMGKWTKRLFRLGVLGAVVAALFIFHTELRIAGPFVVLPVHNADVRAEVEGILQEIYVQEGDAVKKGAALAALSDRDYLAEMRKTKAEIQEKQARLNLLKAGTRPEEIELARTLEAKAEERLHYATNVLEMDRVLAADHLISKREFEQSREQVAVRGKELREAKDRLKLLLAGSRQEDIDATAAEIARLQAQQRYLEEQLQLLKIFSPVDGIITTHKLKEKIGQAVKKGELITKVHAMQIVTVEIAVPETDIADVNLGQQVVLKARAYPWTSFEGKVTAIAPVVTEPKENEVRTERSVLVTTQLDNASGLLKPDMTGHAKIFCRQQRLVDIVLRRFVRFLKVEFWSWW